MTRQVSLNAMRAMLKEQVDEVFLRILKIEHASLASPILLVADKQNLVRADGTYTPFGFDIVLPEDDEENIGGINLIVPTVDLSFVTKLRSIQDEFTVTLSIVRQSAPDTAEVGPFVFLSQSMDFDLIKTTIALVYNRNIAQDAFPKDSFAPSNKP